ncbi:MAG: DUF47 domain-containing protein [Acidobacteria bacterium]|nr:DUF47 domain-containing protein [Acidobacteriota bacterium]
MKFRFLPREEKFFHLFQEQIAIAVKVAGLLLEGVRLGNSRLAENADKILELEHQGDDLIHEVLSRLNRSFITPLDPEDIHRLAAALDDVIDHIEEAAHLIVAYRLPEIPRAVIQLAEIIDAGCNALRKAFLALEKDRREMAPFIVEINDLENQADRVTRSAVAELFNSGDALLIFKLKEIYDTLEATTDRCADAADVLQNVVVKNS